MQRNQKGRNCGAEEGEEGQPPAAAAEGTQFIGFTGTKVQILTQLCIEEGGFCKVLQKEEAGFMSQDSTALPTQAKVQQRVQKSSRNRRVQKSSRNRTRTRVRPPVSDRVRSQAIGPSCLYAPGEKIKAGNYQGGFSPYRMVAPPAAGERLGTGISC
jgi:hypothetical protein